MSEQSIFLEALDRGDPSERAAYLDQACADDAKLRRRIEALLQSHAKAGDFLDRPAPQQLALGGDTPEGHAGSVGSETPSERREGSGALDFLEPSLTPGALGQLGHYEVREVVGKGGMGMVLRAFDTKLHRVVAVKVPAPQLATNGSARQRFVREARVAAAIAHDHVIHIYAVEDDGPLPYLVMQFIDGLTLQQQLDRRGPLPVREVVRIGMQIADGLAAAHRHGLVHRDVKPANVLLENDGERVKITDFGLARAVDDASLTQSGVIAGTPAYMSPEQASGEPIDPRTDLFSLGSVLYALCAGQAPFRAESTMAVLKRVCEEVPRPLREVNPDVPEWLAAIVARLHAKDPTERYQTAAEVAELLGRHLPGLQQPGLETAQPRPPRVFEGNERPSGSASYSARRLAAGAALLALGIAVACWMWWRPGATRTPNESSGTAREAPSWQPQPTAEELARLPSPLDALKREARALPENAPPELLAVLGGPPRFRLPEPASHWMGQTGDGRLLAVPCGVNILLFDAHAGTLLRTLTGHTAHAYRPAFSPDGKRLASGSGNFILRVWDVETGREELAFKEHRHWVWSVAYDPEGKRLVSADGSGTVKVWDASGQPVHSFPAHTMGINHLAFSPDGKRLATASLDGTCKLWGSESWQEVRSLPGNGKTFESVAWSRDGDLLAAGDDAEVLVWKADTGELLRTLKTPGKGLVAFTPDGRSLLTARHDCSRGERAAWTRWDVTTGTRQTTRDLPTVGTFAFLHLSPDGETLFVSGNQAAGSVGAFDAETGQERFPSQGHRGAVVSVAVSPDGRTLASGGVDRTVRLWDLAGWPPGEPLPPARSLEGHTDQVWSVAFSPNGRLLASGGLDGLIVLWDAASGRKVHELAGHSAKYSILTFSPDGRTVAAGADDGTINFWDALTGEPREPRRGHAGPVRAVACSPDGRALASAGNDKTVRLVDLAGGRAHVFHGSTAFTNLAFSPDGRTLAAVCEAPDNAVRLWDVETGAERARAGHTSTTVGVAFHPAGRLLATASWDGTVRLWDAAPGGTHVRALDVSASGRAERLAFTTEGRHLVVGLGSGQVAVFRVPAAPPEYSPVPVARLPDPADLAKRPAAADVLKREDIPDELLKKAGPGDRDAVPPELVAIFGEDRDAGGERRNFLSSVAISPDGKALAFGGVEKVVWLIELATGKPRRWTWKTQPLDGDAYSLAFRPDGKALACATRAGSIYLWDAATGAELRHVATSDLHVNQIAFSPDGTLLASAGENPGGMVRLWDAATGQLRFRARTPGSWTAWSVAFSPDGRTLAAGVEAGEVWLWDVASSWQIGTLSGLGGAVRWLGFHPDGRSLAVAGGLAGNAVTVWDPSTRKLRRRLSGHGSSVLAGAWRADGQVLVTAGATDGTVRLWDMRGALPQSRVISVIPPNLPYLHAIALSPEGRHVAVTHANGTVCILRLAKQGELVEVAADSVK